MDSFTIIVIGVGGFVCGAAAMAGLELFYAAKLRGDLAAMFNRETTGTEFWPGEMR